ncbi:MAG TPA: BamA/TamA family outer membrane protein [Abditibacteriaceae bacterium]
MHRIFNVTSPAVHTPHSLSHQFALWQKSSQLSPRALAPILALAWGTTMVSQAQASASDLPQLSVAAHNFEPIIRVHNRIAPLEQQEKATKTPDSPVLIAQAGTNQGDNNQTNQPAASPDAKTEPEGLKVPIGEKKDENPPQPPVEIGPRTGGSTLPRPGGSTLPAPTITTPATNAATNQEGPNEAAIAQAEGREVAQVRIVGLRVIPEESVLLQATNIRRGAAFSRRQAELDRAKIASMGFFASVQYQVTPNLEDAAKVDVAFVVIENRVVTGFAFEGNKTVPTAELQKVVQTQSGGVLNNNTLNADVEKLQDFYRERGFAALITEVKQREDGTVAFTIQEAKVSRIVLSGLRKTKESLVRKLIRTKPGDAFDQRKLQRDLNQIYDTGFFEDVTYKIDDDPDQPGGLIITIGIKEKRTGTFTLGVGFDSRSKISGFITLGESNFQGSGKRVSASVEVGSQQTFDLGYGNPFIGPKNAAYNAAIYSRRIYREPRAVNILFPNLDVNSFYEERRTGGRLDYTMPLDLNRTKSLIFGFRNEKARLLRTDLSGNASPLPNTASGRISAPSIGYVRDKRDLRLDPSRGSREQIIVEKAFGFLGGESNFTKVDLDLRRYIPLIKAPKRNELPKLVLAGRFVLGKSLGQLPAFEQYFVGGSDTVRGYDTDEQFGDNQIYGNIELRYRLQRKFQIVGFVDAGSAYGGNFASSGNPRAIVGIGGGIRVQTPIGPLRLDIGRGDDGIKTHFGIGAQF